MAHAFIRNCPNPEVRTTILSQHCRTNTARLTPAVPYSKTRPSGFVYFRAASEMAALIFSDAIAAVSILIQSNELGRWAGEKTRQVL